MTAPVLSGYYLLSATTTASRVLAACGLCGILGGPLLAAEGAPHSGGAAQPSELVAAQTSTAASLQLDAAIRVGLIPGRTRIVIDLSGAPDYRVYSLDAPDRVVVDIGNARLEAPVSAAEFAGTPVIRLRSGVRNQVDLRLVLDLNEIPARFESFALESDEYGGDRLVLDLYDIGVSAADGEIHEPVGEDTPAVIPREGEHASSGGATGSRRSSGMETRALPEQAPAPPGEASASQDQWPRIVGYGELSGAYTYGEPSHWSQLRTRFELGSSGSSPLGGRYRLFARAEADGAFRLEDDYYPEAVRKDQELEFSIREAYLDLSGEEWEYRLGRQHIVWGEMVGLFLADVVSAKDTREFYLPEFETMRIPQWAVRAERFSGDSHFELVWVPYQSYDEIGEPGADFYPYPIAPGTHVREVIPSRSDLAHTSIGARYSRLVAGWDMTGFYYQSNDVSPTLYTTASGLELRHDRIDQLGSTFSKGYMDFVLKGEAVYTSGRSFLSAAPSSPYGLESSDSLEYILGVTVPRGDWRFDLQLYGRHLFDYAPGMLSDEDEFGATLLANRRFGERFEAELLYLTGLNRSDYSVQSRLIWSIDQHWRLQLGVDIFGGDELGFYGRYGDRDRVSIALRRWF